MKHSIARLELQSNGRWSAVMQNGDGSWFVGNVKDIPTNLLDDGVCHLVKYAPEDQFCYYVSPGTVEQGAKALASLSEVTEELIEWARDNDKPLPVPSSMWRRAIGVLGQE